MGVPPRDILVHDNLVVFWIFMQFQLRQSNYLKYRSAFLQGVNLSATAKIYRSLWFSYFCQHLGTFFANAVMGNLHTEERASRTNFDWLFCWISINQKSGRRRSVEGLYQALFFVSPVPPECFTERNENRAWSQVTLDKDWKILVHYHMHFRWATLVHVFGVFYISQMLLRNPCLALTKTTWDKKYHYL